MGNDERDFFISYNKADVQWAKWIAYVLESKGYSTFIQAWDFRPGNNFVTQMQKASVKSKRFIAVLSPDYLSSPYCQDEFAAAYTKNANTEERTLFPIRVADFEPEGLFSAIIYIDFVDIDEETAKKRLIQGIDTNDIPRKRPIFPGASKIPFPGTSRIQLPSTPEARLPGSLPLNNLPYIRNESFTGRETILADIHSRFRSESENVLSLTQSITGLGGIGKTQLALEYAYRYASEYDLIWWVPAETDSTVLSSYREFCVRMKLLEREQEDSRIIIEAVLKWLDTHDNWLFIFDNIDDLSSATPWWPRNNKSNILSTTRNRHIHVGKSIDISLFTANEAKSFLEKRSGIEDSTNDINELVQRLGFLPLALEQAAAYIKNNDCIYAEYLELLSEHGLSVLDEVDGMIDYEKSVNATWEISLEKISQESSRQLLYLCSYLAPENIDMKLFLDNADELSAPLNKDFSNNLDTKKVLKELTRYALLTKQDSGNYSMHRLLQEVVRNKLRTDSQWIICLLNIFIETYEFTYDTLGAFISSTPHVEALILTASNILFNNEEQEKISFLCSNVGHGSYLLGNYSKALEWHCRDLTICEKVLGNKHPDTANSYNNIATVYSMQGDYAQALQWHLKALTIYEEVLGKNHASTATSYNNIAGVYSSQSNYCKSLEWFQKALAIREKVLGVEHPDTATTYNNIAEVYSNQGNYTLALEWHQKVLSIRQKVLGNEHPDIATTYNNIASVYSNQGNYPEALKWYQKDLDICERVLGKDHPSTATNYNNTAGIYQDQGNYAQALEWYRKALKIREKVLGKEHPDTATTYNNIASVFSKQIDYHNAMKFYKKALTICEKIFGKEHPNTATTYNNIAEIYYEQNDYSRALKYYQNALAIYEKTLGIEHTLTAMTYNNIAGIYSIYGDYTKALEWYQKDIIIIEKLLGREHPDTAITYNNIASVYFRQGDYVQALEWFQKALLIFESKLGEDHPSTKTVQENINMILES